MNRDSIENWLIRNVDDYTDRKNKEDVNSLFDKLVDASKNMKYNCLVNGIPQTKQIFDNSHKEIFTRFCYKFSNG